MDKDARQAAVTQAVAAWHRYLEHNDAAELRALVADDVVFRSPVAHTPYPGPDAIVLVLTTVNTVFENFRYHREFRSDDGLSVGLEFSAEIDGKALKGIDLIRFHPDGKIAEFEVMVRPASGLAALQAAMGARLADQKAVLAGGAAR